MSEDQQQTGSEGAKSGQVSLRQWAMTEAQRFWRPAGTAVVLLLALLLTWHVIHGQHGISVWQHMRTEDRDLQRQIQQLQKDNTQMQQQVQRLQSDPEAIEHEARERLHYAKPGEVIVTLPAQHDPPSNK